MYDDQAYIIQTANEKPIGGFITHNIGTSGIPNTNKPLEDLYNALTDYGRNKDTSKTQIKIGSYDAMMVYTVALVESEKDGKILRYLFVNLGNDQVMVASAVYYESEKSIYDDTVTAIFASIKVSNER